MYQLTLTNLRYGETSSWEYFYAKDDIQLAEIKEYLFTKQDINSAVEIEYSINDEDCKPTDNWNEVYWTFEKTDNTPKWGYSLEIKSIKFRV